MQCARAFAIFTRIDFPPFPVFYRPAEKKWWIVSKANKTGQFSIITPSPSLRATPPIITHKILQFCGWFRPGSSWHPVPTCVIRHYYASFAERKTGYRAPAVWRHWGLDNRRYDDSAPFPVFYRTRGKEGVDCEQSEQDGAVQYNHNHTRCSGNSQLPHRLRRSPPPREGNIPPCRHPGAGRDPVCESKLALFCFITQVDDKCRQLDTARPRYDDKAVGTADT